MRLKEIMKHLGLQSILAFYKSTPARIPTHEDVLSKWCGSLSRELKDVFGLKPIRIINAYVPAENDTVRANT